MTCIIPDSLKMRVQAKLRENDEAAAHVWWKHFIAGGMAGAVSRTCTAPLDRLKVLLQVQKPGQYRPINDVLHEILHDGGVRAFWRGNGVNVIKIAPESAIRFLVFDQAKTIISHHRGHDKVTTIDRFASGASAGVISQILIYPMEVIKVSKQASMTIERVLI